MLTNGGDPRVTQSDTGKVAPDGPLPNGLKEEPRNILTKGTHRPLSFLQQEGGKPLRTTFPEHRKLLPSVSKTPWVSEGLRDPVDSESTSFPLPFANRGRTARVSLNCFHDSVGRMCVGSCAALASFRGSLALFPLRSGIPHKVLGGWVAEGVAGLLGRSLREEWMPQDYTSICIKMRKKNI